MPKGELSRLLQLAESQPRAIDTKYSEIVSQRAWADALRLAEEALLADPGDIEAKLIWLQSQFESESVPISALASSFEDSLKNISDSLRPVAVGVGLRICGRLEDKKQLRLAILLLEQVISEFEKISSSGAQSARVTYRSLLEEEIERAEQRREAKPYIAGLQKKLAAIPAIEEPPKEEPVRQKKDVRSAKDIVQAAAEKKDATSLPELTETPTSRNLHLGWAFAAAGVVLLLFFASTVFSPSDHAEDLLAIEISFPQTSVLPDATSELLTAAPADSSARLDEVSKRLESLSTKKEEPAPQPEQTLQWKGEPEPSNPPPAEMAQERAPFRPSSPSVARKTPELDAEKLSKNVIESLDREIQTAPDGRVYGPGPSGDVKGYEVEQLPEPVFYKTITATTVLSAPSVMASQLAQLDSNAKIQVVSRMGKWLELRSSGGRKGYIYAQDAVEVNEEESSKGSRR